MQRPSALLGVLALVLALAGPVAAQEATPEVPGSILAGMGYRELQVTVTDDGFEVPAEVDAGRTLIVYENAGQESRHSLLMKLPDGTDPEQALDELHAESEEPPEWLLKATFPGFAGETLPGETSVAVVDLVPGPYMLIDDFAVTFEVMAGAAGATPVAAEDPASDATVDLFEYGFMFPETVEPGRQVWEITNSGAKPHELLLAWSPEPVMASQIIEMITNESEDENATPVGGGPSFAEIEPVGGIGWLSPGNTAWTEMNLRPGTYIAMCFVFDDETGMLHVEHGMVDVFTVEEAL
jgi:hypothetical protein